MTLDLDEIEKACAVATEGPWRVQLGSERNRITGVDCDDTIALAPRLGGARGDANAVLLAAGPALVAEVRRLREYRRLITGTVVLESGPPDVGETKPQGDACVTMVTTRLGARLKTLEEAKAEGHAEGYAQALEEAARLADTLVNPDTEDAEAVGWSHQIVAAIRALGEK